MNLNELTVFEGYSEVTLQAVNTTKEINPANPTGLYTYYKVDDESSSYVDVSATVKNVSGNDLLASNLLTMKLIDADGMNIQQLYYVKMMKELLWIKD